MEPSTLTLALSQAWERELCLPLCGEIEYATALEMLLEMDVFAKIEHMFAIEPPKDFTHGFNQLSCKIREVCAGLDT